MRTMVTHYDVNLRSKLGIPRRGHSLVLNPYFHSFTHGIAKHIDPFTFSSDLRYERAENKDLLECAQEHAARHQKKEIQIKKMIVLVHPFYLHLVHMNALRTPTVQQEADKYLYSLFDLLCWNREAFHFPIVLFETLHHYAAVTSLLLEQGFITSVLFTQCDSGMPLEKTAVTPLKDCFTFFGGGYNYRCLTSAVKAVADVNSPQQLWAVKEFVLNSPYDSPYVLQPAQVEGIAKERTISLEETLRQLSR